MSDEPKPAADSAESSRFFQKVDWAAFWLALVLSLVVYLLTLAPDVTLEYAGIYATDAMYPGPSVPPGHPLWAIYGWLFIKLIPALNIAWRLNFASSVAGALTCGLIAMLVSRVGMLGIETIPEFNKFTAKEQKAFRVVCGCVAGLGFGLDGCFWRKAVVADTWPLSLCLFAVTICLLTRWFFASRRRSMLFAAVFVYGLTVSESQALIPAALGLLFLVTLKDAKLGRDLLFGVSIFLWVFLLFAGRWSHLGWFVSMADTWVLIAVSSIVTIVWIVLTRRTRSLLSEWIAAFFCALLLFAGLSPYFLLPLFSMTNPPVNWGYPRTVEGFFHLLSRGQFESFFPVLSPKRLLDECGIYASISVDNFGILYSLAATLPFVFICKLPQQPRRWAFGLLALWFSMTLLMLVMVNMDHLTAPYQRFYFASTHLVLALLSGCGLMLVAAFFAKFMVKSRAQQNPQEIKTPNSGLDTPADSLGPNTPII